MCIRDRYYMTLGESCKIHPIADDMACALKSFQDPESGKLRILDAEDGWLSLIHISKENGPFGTPRERLLIGSLGLE